MKQTAEAMCHSCGKHATVRWCDVYHSTPETRHRCEKCKDKDIPEVYVKVEWTDADSYEKEQPTWRLIDTFVFQPTLGRFIKLKLIDHQMQKKFEYLLRQGVKESVDGSQSGIYRFTVTGEGANKPQPEKPCMTCENNAPYKGNLKGLLMELGNTLVTEHGYLPATSPSNRQDAANTWPLRDLTDWLNNSPEAQQVLKEMGWEWPV